MKTRQLYYEEPYCRSFTATVLRCENAKGGFAVVLDQTAFFPEGGGQAPDCGTLNGIRVKDVQEHGDEIIHLCADALPVGTQVQGELDWAHRFDLMQQHSGEHLVSGIIHARYGWDNVGFHMGTDVITIDFNGLIPPEDLPGIEQAVNDAIWRNIETDIFFPDAEALAALPYRSKKALTGAVRLVRFGDIDLCACCGTHVARTGEIGLVKLLSCIHFREGVRIELLCGKRAFDYLSAVLEQNRQTSVLLSAKPLQTAQAVRRVYDERAQIQYRLGVMETESFQRRAAALEGAGDVLLFETGLSPDSVRRLCVAVMERCGGRCAVFSGTDSDGYKYAVGETDGDLRSFVKAMNTALQGRGGGKPFFAQGSVQAARAQIEAFFADTARG